MSFLLGALPSARSCITVIRTLLLLQAGFYKGFDSLSRKDDLAFLTRKYSYFLKSTEDLPKFCLLCHSFASL